MQGFDTIKFFETYLMVRDVSTMLSNGGEPRFNGVTGEPTKIILNGALSSKMPCLTLISVGTRWRLYASVSFGAWLSGSNLFLTQENDIKKYCCLLSEYVSDMTGLRFDSYKCRLSRVDITRNYHTYRENVLRIIKALQNILEIPKYIATIKPTSVYFDTRGNNRRILCYDKFAELLSKGASKTELELAYDLFRLEIQYKDARAVRDLAQSMKVKNSAETLLTQKTVDKVITRTEKMLSLQSLIVQDSSFVRSLFDLHGKHALSLISHLYLKGEYGNDYFNLPFIPFSKDTAKRYEQKCAEMGILSLYE